MARVSQRQTLLLLTRWVNLNSGKRQELNSLFALNRKLFKAYLLKESLDRLWTYRYEGAMLNYLQSWMNQLCWQRLRPFEKLADMLLHHLEGILNYCRTKVPLGMVEAINGNIKSLLRRGRGYKNLRYLLLKAQRMAATRTEFVVSGKLPKMRVPSNSCAEPTFEHSPRPSRRDLRYCPGYLRWDFRARGKQALQET